MTNKEKKYFEEFKNNNNDRHINAYILNNDNEEAETPADIYKEEIYNTLFNFKKNNFEQKADTRISK